MRVPEDGDEEPRPVEEAPGEVIEEAPPGAEASAPVTPQERPGSGRFLVRVRVGALPVTGNATATEGTIAPGTAVIVRTSRGTEMGVALSRPRAAEGELGATVGHVVRAATEADIQRQREIEEKLEPEETRYCRQKIQERGLKMKLSGVEHIWGGERIVFYFTAERRVDFRALVRDLAWHFHTRIELRQIGARDEARLLADFEHCGRELCCRAFLTTLEPVSMRMAKLQRTTLDPHKISGRCGRLMCCLRFEDEVYRELARSLPPRGARVRVGAAEGEVVSTETLTQKVVVRYGDGEMAKVHVSELEMIAASGSRISRDDGGGPTEGRPDRGEARSPSGRGESQSHRQAASPPAGSGRHGPGRRPAGARPSARTEGAESRPAAAGGQSSAHGSGARAESPPVAPSERPSGGPAGGKDGAE